MRLLLSLPSGPLFKYFPTKACSTSFAKMVRAFYKLCVQEENCISQVYPYFYFI